MSTSTLEDIKQEIREFPNFETGSYEYNAEAMGNTIQYFYDGQIRVARVRDRGDIFFTYQSRKNGEFTPLEVIFEFLALPMPNTEEDWMAVAHKYAEQILEIKRNPETYKRYQIFLDHRLETY